MQLRERSVPISAEPAALCSSSYGCPGNRSYMREFPNRGFATAMLLDVGKPTGRPSDVRIDVIGTEKR